MRSKLFFLLIAALTAAALYAQNVTPGRGGGGSGSGQPANASLTNLSNTAIFTAAANGDIKQAGTLYATGNLYTANSAQGGNTSFYHNFTNDYVPFVFVKGTNEALRYDASLGIVVDDNASSWSMARFQGTHNPSTTNITTILNLESFGEVNNSALSLQVVNSTDQNLAVINLQPSGGAPQITIRSDNTANSGITFGTSFSVGTNGSISTTGNTTSKNGVYYPSNTLTVATIKAGMTNGAFWVGTLSNALQSVWMSNNVALFKILAP